MDAETGELVFEAVSGEGEKELVGSRFPAGTGIAGWVATSGQPMVADDLRETKFDHDAAESTGYVPATIMAAPLIRFEECEGVLEVLDRADRAATSTTSSCSACSPPRRPAAWVPAPGQQSESRPAIDPQDVLRRLSDRPPNGDGPRDVAALKLLALADELLAHH